MKSKKVTITYQATEPKECVYILSMHYGEGKVDKRIVANIESLLEWFFDDLDYRKNTSGEFAPNWTQPVYHLKDCYRRICGQRVEKVEIEYNPLYL